MDGCCKTQSPNCSGDGTASETQACLLTREGHWEHHQRLCAGTVETDLFGRIQFLPFALILWPRYPSLFTLALPHNSSSRETKHGLFAEATAEDYANAQRNEQLSCTGRCELVFVPYQIKILPEACQCSSEKGLWCCEPAQAEGRWEQAGGNELEAAWASPEDMELRWQSHTYFWKTPPAKSAPCPYSLFSRELHTEQLQGCLILIEICSGSSCPVSPHY